MSKRRLTLLLLIAVLAAVTVYAIFYPTNAAGEEPGIRYPKTAGEGLEPMEDIIGSNRRLVEQVIIDADNGQQVLSMLGRPAEYTAAYEIAYYLEDGRTTVLMIQLWVTPEMQKVFQRSVDGNDFKHTLLTRENIYIWDGEENGEYAGKAGSFTVDDIGHILTYENLLKLERKSILSAQLVPLEENQGPCLVLEASNPLSGYREVYTILADTGLLIACRVYDGGRCIYQMTQTDMQAGLINREEIFVLPSGNLPL